jgi:hypothetical protein
MFIPIPNQTDANILPLTSTKLITCTCTYDIDYRRSSFICHLYRHPSNKIRLANFMLAEERQSISGSSAEGPEASMALDPCPVKSLGKVTQVAPTS